MGCNPHFVGRGRMQMKVTGSYPERTLKNLDGKILGWANPRSDDPKDGDFRLTIDVPDFDLIRDRLAISMTVTVQVAAFAHEMKCFEDDSAFYASQAAEKSRFAAEHFIPFGQFAAAFREAAPPGPAEAMFGGHVRTFEVVSNPVDHRPFYYTLVQTFGGSIDVVADPEITKGSPTEGGVLHGTFWLSGRIVSELAPPAREPWVRRLFARSATT